MRIFNMLYSVIILSLFSCAIAQNDIPGEISFYYDASCLHPSTTLPKTSLALETCLIPVGGKGVVINAYPPCPNGGSASLITYQDACSQRAGKKYGDQCYYYFQNEDFGGIMFTCENPDTSPQPTSSTTVTVSGDAGVATIAPATSGTPSPKTSVSTTAAGSGGGGGEVPSPTSRGNNDSTGTPSGDSSSTKSGGLSQSDKIAIGVGLGVGIPSILLALAGVCLAARSRL